jgi:hypothetical protein
MACSCGCPYVYVPVSEHGAGATPRGIRRSRFTTMTIAAGARGHQWFFPSPGRPPLTNPVAVSPFMYLGARPSKGARPDPSHLWPSLPVCEIIRPSVVRTPSFFRHTAQVALSRLCTGLRGARWLHTRPWDLCWIIFPPDPTSIRPLQPGHLRRTTRLLAFLVAGLSGLPERLRILPAGLLEPGLVCPRLAACLTASSLCRAKY